MLDQVRDRVTLNVEIKSARDLGVIEPKLATLVGEARAEEWVVFSSFHEEAVRNMRAAASWARLGVLCDEDPRRRGLALALELDAEVLIPDGAGSILASSRRPTCAGSTSGCGR